ncbi:MAG: glycosyltransferase, partial [Bacteroidetes bacterium]
MDKRKHIAILIDWYLPGYQAGGPIQTIHNLVQALGGEFRFSIITTDTDHGASTPYPEIESNQWISRSDGSQVYYFSQANLQSSRLSELLDALQPDLVYLQSMFSQPFTRWPLQWAKDRA